MKKSNFLEWLQYELDATSRENKGEVWRYIEGQDLLGKLGVKYAFDYYNQVMFFLCEDGFLSSNCKVGEEGETIWIFAGSDVNSNMRESSPKEVDKALGSARVAVMDLEKLLPFPRN